MITVGQKVILKPDKTYITRLELSGRLGTVKKKIVDSVGIYFKEYPNPNSKDGVFWFKEDDLFDLPDMGEIAEKLITAINMVDSKYICVTWEDGTKTAVICKYDVQKNRYIGYCTAVSKKLFNRHDKIKKAVDLYFVN